jgi:hypothetical protein
VSGHDRLPRRLHVACTTRLSLLADCSGEFPLRHFEAPLDFELFCAGSICRRTARTAYANDMASNAALPASTA